jgi:hypothetical protein
LTRYRRPDDTLALGSSLAGHDVHRMDANRPVPAERQLRWDPVGWRMTARWPEIGVTLRGAHMTVSPTRRTIVPLTRVRIALGLSALAGALLAGPVMRAQSNQPGEEFNAFAVNMGALTQGSTASLIITVNRWSSEAEKEKVIGTLKEKGPEAMLRVLQDIPRIGSIRTPQSIGYDLRLALSEPGKDGGRRVIIATDRPIGFIEATNRTRTMDYPLTVIDMQLGADGTGTGTMSVAARMIPAGRTVLVENFDTQPVRLTKIESRKLKQ